MTNDSYLPSLSYVFCNQVETQEGDQQCNNKTSLCKPPKLATLLQQQHLQAIVLLLQVLHQGMISMPYVMLSECRYKVINHTSEQEFS